MAFSYSGDPSASDKDAVRFEIQDTTSTSPLLQDGEVEWCILSETGIAAGTPATIAPPGLYLAAARCMETLARLFSMQADTQIGTLKTTYTKQADQYTTRAKELRAKAQGMYAPYAGGLSISEKQAAAQDSDAVQPTFAKQQFSNPWAGDEGAVGPDDIFPPVD